MPRNGSGTYAGPANSANPAVTNTTISSTDFNALVDDIETAITNSIATDGQTTTTAAIPFAAGVKTDTIDELTSAAGVTVDSLLIKDGQAGGVTLTGGTLDSYSVTGKHASTGSADNYVLTPTTALAAYSTGARYSFRANFANTGAATLNISSLGAKTIKKMTTSGKADLASGDIQNGQPVTVEYDGTDLIMVTPPTVVAATSVDINGLTAETTISGSSDTVAIYDASEGANNKATVNNLNKGWVFLSSQPASSSAQLDFTGLDSTYAAYMFEFEGVTPATDNVALQARVSNDNGSTFLSTASYQFWRATANVGADAESIDRANNGTAHRIAGSIGNGANEGFTGVLVAQGIGVAATDLPYFESEGKSIDATTAAFFFSRSRGAVASAATYNAIRFFMSSGNIASGTIRCYGLRKS